MKTPELLHELNTCIHVVESTLRTTIHLINGSKIITDDSTDFEIENEITLGEVHHDLN